MKFFRRVLIAFLVIALLAVAVDRVSVWLVNHRVNQVLEDWEFTDPEISIKDLPFLPVLWNQKVDNVTLNAKQWLTVVDQQEVHVRNPQLSLSGTHLDGSFHLTEVESYQGSAQVPVADLTALVQNYYRNLKISTDGDKLRASISVWGVPIGINLNLEAGGVSRDNYPQIRISPDLSAITGNATLQKIIGKEAITQLKKKFEGGYPIVFSQAPQGCSIDSISVRDSVITVGFSGKHLDPNSFANKKQSNALGN